jgi:hypothetical protein
VVNRISDKLAELAKRVVSNVPDRRQPEQFHAEKSEIAHELRKIAREAEGAKP